MLMFDNGIFAWFIPQIIMVVAYISCFIAPNSDNQQTEINSSEKILVVANSDSTDVNKTANNCIDFYSDFQGVNNEPSFQLFKRNFIVKISLNQYFRLSDKTPTFHFSRPPPAFA